MTNYIVCCACSCKFKPFFIFLFLEYRKLTSFVLLLGTRRQRKIKNHLKFAASHKNVLIRFGLEYFVADKIKISSKIIAWCEHTVWLYIFQFNLYTWMLPHPSTSFNNFPPNALQIFSPFVPTGSQVVIPRTSSYSDSSG